MNCTPGCLAMIVRGLDGPENRLTGSIVRVGTLAFRTSKFGPVWNIEHARPQLALLVTPRAGTVKGIGPMKRAGHCPDAWLRPIGEPAEDMVDETLQRLPAPREAVPA